MNPVFRQFLRYIVRKAAIVYQIKGAALLGIFSAIIAYLKIENFVHATLLNYFSGALFEFLL